MTNRPILPSGDSYPLPELLFHYQAINAPRLMDRLRHTLLNHQIYFSSPADFNDPFDCKVWPSFEGSPEQKREYVNRVARKNGSDNEIMRQRIEFALADPEYFNKTFEDFQRNAIPTLGVYCLTERPDDILMWSHYAGSHTGICLAFAANYIFPDCAIQRVTYPENNQYPTVNFFKSSKEEQTDVVLCTKAKHWEYEREWRVVNISGFGLYDIRPEWLVGLIVGCQMPQAQVTEISRIASKRTPALRLLQARQKSREFALTIEQSANQM